MACCATVLSRLSLQDEIQALPQERIAAVRPFWETVSKEERAQLLTLNVEDLRERAAMLTERYQKQAGVHPRALYMLYNDRRCKMMRKPHFAPQTCYFSWPLTLPWM